MAWDITAIGEILIDLTQTGHNEQGIPQYAANPGGAPANVAVAGAKLGAKTAFIGCVGRDAFGRQLRETLEENRVDTAGLAETDQAPTTLAVVSVDGRGERSFQFYRAPGADLCLAENMIPAELLTGTKILHFGSVSLTGQPSRNATLFAAGQARMLGKLVSYDPNYRASLWPDREAAVRCMREALPLAHIVKISDEETELLTGAAEASEAAAHLEALGAELVLVTLGEKGVLYRWQGNTGTVPGFSVIVADTNGAGDSFLGAVLSRLVGREGLLDGLTVSELEEILRFANRAAAMTTSRPGAIPAMPTLAEVEREAVRTEI